MTAAGTGALVGAGFDEAPETAGFGLGVAGAAAMESPPQAARAIRRKAPTHARATLRLLPMALLIVVV